MENNFTKGYSECIKEISDEFLGFVSMEFPINICEDCAQMVESNVLPLLNSEKPKVMVYGIYNSGKSTLINALMRSEVAEIADKPMTDKISEFDNGEYILVDSPGVDAPIQHEDITTAFLNKCHIILFVISSKGGFESKKNYEKMAELMLLGIPFIIVLNERGYLSMPEWTPEQKIAAKLNYENELKEVQYKIIDNLISITGKKDITDKYEVYVLNAKKALKGILENKEKLYETSKISVLESRIEKMVQGSEINKVLKTPIANLRCAFDFIEKIIIDEMQNVSKYNYSSKIELLRKKHENLKNEIRVIIRYETERLIDETTAFFVNGDVDHLITLQYDLFETIEEKYAAHLNMLASCAKRSLNEIESIDQLIEYSGLFFEPEEFKGFQFNQDNADNEEVKYGIAGGNTDEPRKKFWQSQKAYERKLRSYYEKMAEKQNAFNLNKVNEELRAKQEARQRANGILFDIQKKLIEIFNNDLSEKFDLLLDAINNFVCDNKETYERAKTKLDELNLYRKKLDEIENKIF